MRSITGVDTSIVLFIGWAPRGSSTAAIRLTSFAEFERQYGGLDSRSHLGYAVRQFYDNGGSDAFVVRIAGTDALPAVAGTPGNNGSVIGPADAAFRTAVIALFGAGGVIDRIDLFNLVCVPGLTEPTTIATLQLECRRRRAFLILDAPEGETVASMPAVASGLAGPDAMNSALYFPWIRADDPLSPGAVRAFPPCGFVAGVYARTDAARGVWKAPAGRDAGVSAALGPTITLSDQENRQLNSLGIDCLRKLPGAGTVVWGARTLHADNDSASEWKYVPVRRLALFLEESLGRGTQWVVFEPNNEPLWARIRLDVSAFMQDLFRQGAFKGTSPRDAYFVRCDGTTTTQADIDRGIVNILVGFAPLRPGEFVVLKVQQATGKPPS